MTEEDDDLKARDKGFEEEEEWDSRIASQYQHVHSE